MSMLKPPSPESEITCRPGCAACTPMPCAMAFAMEPCTQEPMSRLRPFMAR